MFAKSCWPKEARTILLTAHCRMKRMPWQRASLGRDAKSDSERSMLLAEPIVLFEAEGDAAQGCCRLQEGCMGGVGRVGPWLDG